MQFKFVHIATNIIVSSSFVHFIEEALFHILKAIVAGHVGHVEGDNFAGCLVAKDDAFHSSDGCGDAIHEAALPVILTLSGAELQFRRRLNGTSILPKIHSHQLQMRK